MGHDHNYDRRTFLATALSWLGALTAGLLTGGTGCDAPPPPNDRDADDEDDQLEPTPSCEPTSSDIEGPYYRSDAPYRTDLTGGEAMDGVPLEVSGRVLSTDCQPLPSAHLDVWQANDEGRYDNDGTDDPPSDVFVLRARLHADAEGRYRFTTIVPGRYEVSDGVRPAHLHLKIQAEGHHDLTTQLYFPDDPHNEDDAFFQPELLMAVEDDGVGGKQATFDIVLAPSR